MIRFNNDDEASTIDYKEQTREAASAEAYRRNGNSESNLSTETLPEHASILDCRIFAKEYPEKLFPLLNRLRPEWLEIFLEYYLLDKPQSFIAQTHGFIQTRAWQALRIIEQTLGAFIILGTEPSEDSLRTILEKAKLETTAYGSLAAMIHMYAASQNYALVAKTFGAPIPAIRKIFRPAISKLLADKNIKAVAVGAYLLNLTYRAALTKAGLSKSYQARVKRIKTRRFIAPPFETSPLLSFGAVTSLQETPWCMVELSPETSMTAVYPKIQEHAKRRFGKHPAQIFAPVDADGELTFGYFFARSDSVSVIKTLLKISGVAHIPSAGGRTNEDGTYFFGQAVTVPHEDIQKMMDGYKLPSDQNIAAGNFVELLTGPASGYWGTVTAVHQTKVTVQVQFPSERQFIVSADKSAVKSVDVPVKQRGFWGIIGQEN